MSPIETDDERREVTLEHRLREFKTATVKITISDFAGWATCLLLSAGIREFASTPVAAVATCAIIGGILVLGRIIESSLASRSSGYGARTLHGWIGEELRRSRHLAGSSPFAGSRYIEWWHRTGRPVLNLVALTFSGLVPLLVHAARRADP